uniref:BHLH domain-containing protein n=1 Tax=Globisporangium ultimum (strain ATCC 200006 / CBS 805.95 / DAOM BR144) TaxID=431595 RepID=K3WY35_GLOUD
MPPSANAASSANPRHGLSLEAPVGHAQHQHHVSNATSPLEITYSTISPKVDAQPPYPMHIKLNLIDQNVSSNGDTSSCESPFPMTPMTPGGSVDLSKKQRHNLREQRRILRISNQFDILRNKLEGAGYSSSKKDKYSVLQATLDYISFLERNQQQPGQHQPQQHSTPSSSRGATNDHGNPQQQHISHPPPTPPMPHRLPSPAGPSRLSITAPPPQIDSKGNTFIIDSMPSPVPALSMPGGIQSSFPLDLESNIFASSAGANPGYHMDCIEGSSATYKDVFANSSMPSLLAKLDGTIVEANGLFLELCCKNIDELRLHSLYTMCTAMDAPKMYSLVGKILSCEMASAQSKMMWHFSNTGDRKVFVSVAMIHDNMHRPANLHCSLLPLS